MSKRYKWREWQKLAWGSAVVEPVGEFPQRSCIECPNTMDIDKGVCKAFLLDMPMVVDCGSEKRRIVYCEVCGFVGCRLLGTQDE